MAGKEWTFMIYMAGDNNLSEDMIRAIIELQRQLRDTGDDLNSTGFGDKNNVDFVIEFDGNHPFVNTRRYDLSYNPAPPRPTEIEDLKPDLSNPLSMVERQLKRFVEESITKHQANKYALIISGHGDAFLGKTLLLDEDSDNVATLSGVATALREALAGKSLDVLGFDSCLMNSIEVLYEFKGVAKTIIGSQGEVPNFSWDYAEIGKRLMQEPIGTLDSSKIIEHIKNSIQRYNRDFAFGGRSVDFCAIDTSKIDTLSKKIDFLGLMLTAIITNHLTIKESDKETYIGSHISQLLLKTHWNCQTYMEDQSVDIGDFITRLRIGCENLLDDLLRSVSVNVNERIKLIGYLLLIRQICQELSHELMQNNIVSKGMYVGADYQFSNGVSMFYPWSVLGFFMIKEKYKGLEFTKNHRSWASFLSIYTFLTSRSRPDFDQTKLPSNMETIFRDINSFFDDLSVRSVILLFITNFGIDGIYPSIIPTTTVSTTILNTFGVITIGDLDKFLLQPLFNPPRSKFNPPRSKGLDSYLYHFSKTNNIYPNLNIEGTFPPKQRLPEIV
jgi:hypothetical protein